MSLISYRRLTILGLTLGSLVPLTVTPVAAQPVPPTCEITGSPLTCGPTHLCAVASPPGPAYTFRWTGPGGFTATTQCIDVFRTGFNNTFFVVVTDPVTGLSSEQCTISIKSLFKPPCTISGTPVICNGSTTELCGPEGPDPHEGGPLRYRWTGPNLPPTESRCITATAVGDYTLTVFNDASCDTSCTVTVRRGDLPCSITGRTRICPGTSTTLCGPPGLSYSWSGPSGASTEQCITTSAPGTYTLTVSSGACTNTCNVTVDNDTTCGEPEGRCWMTGGGSQDDGRGKDFNWGGNVNPGCKPDEGNWNHIDRRLNVHFQGRNIHVVRCGNVEGIPPGSQSPKTPFNFIEFTGPGRISGKGGDGGWRDVFFFGRVEDRAEPGSNGQPNVNARDRYFLHVYSNPADPAGSTVLLVDQDGDPNTKDGVIIDHGNLQLHIKPCPHRGVVTDQTHDGLTPADDGVWFAAPGPNPTHDWTTLTFRIPRDAYCSLKVFDVTGREVRELVSGDFLAGEHSIIWDLSDNNLSPVSGGVFFLRLAVNNKVYSRALAVIH